MFQLVMLDLSLRNAVLLSMWWRCRDNLLFKVTRGWFGVFFVSRVDAV